MRPISIVDIEVAARVLLCVPPNGHADLMAELLQRADIADRYRKRLGRRHPVFGSGTLMSAAQNYPQSGRPAFIRKEMLQALSSVINALK